MKSESFGNSDDKHVKITVVSFKMYFINKLPKVYNGLGISILSTPRGVMSDNEARAANVGGEVLCQVF